jgi:hypothetical protein
MNETDFQERLAGEPTTDCGVQSLRAPVSYGPALVSILGAENREMPPSELAVYAWEQFAAVSPRPSGRIIGDIELMLEYGILAPGDNPSCVRLSAAGQRLASVLRPSPQSLSGMKKPTQAGDL